MPSIRQNPYPEALPDFRNLGITARALIAVNLLALIAALLAEPDWNAMMDAYVMRAARFEPPLVASLVLLYALAPWLLRFSYWSGCALVIAVVLVFTAVTHVMLGEFAPASIARTLVLAASCTAVVLAYLRLHIKAHSPALAEARLQALQARIRPHFLFNSLNAVLSLIRHDPKRAERTLEDLADLFRALMSDGRNLARLADEISLIERYAAIEQLRLGERLRMSWELDNAPMDAMLPALVLQPLLENAIYHGVEPGTGIGDVSVRVERRGDRVLVRIENPWIEPRSGARPGNHMALDNISERLMLFFDDEARLQTSVEGNRFRVDIDIPYRGRA
jgi:two-component system sensor histidine kinase AlgZ